MGTEMINGAKILLECLYRLGITDIFGYPGGAVIPIYDEIYKYVCESTVDRLRIEHKMGSRDYNYFIDTNDNWPELFTYITTGKVVKINDDLSLVPLGFGETKARSAPHLIIFVQKGKNGLRIIKVDGLASEFYAPTRN